MVEQEIENKEEVMSEASDEAISLDAISIDSEEAQETVGEENIDVEADNGSGTNGNSKEDVPEKPSKTNKKSKKNIISFKFISNSYATRIVTVPNQLYGEVSRNNRVLLHDYFSRDLCFIHLDSIIESLIVNEESPGSISFDFNYDLGLNYELHCGPFLHLIHAFEKILKQYLSTYVNIRIIVFPNCSSHLKTAFDGLYYLIRQILVYHIQYFELAPIQIFESNWFHDKEFIEYCDRERPAFIVAPELDDLFVAHILTFNHPLVIRVNKHIAGLVGYELIRKRQLKISRKTKLTDTPLKRTNTLSNFVEYGSSTKIKVVATILKQMVLNEPILHNIHFAQVVLAALNIQEQCSLDERALLKVNYRYLYLNEFLNRLYKELYCHFDVVAEELSPNEWIDLLDGRLCHYLMHCITIDEENMFQVRFDLLNKSVNNLLEQFADDVLNQIEISDAVDLEYYKRELFDVEYPFLCDKNEPLTKHKCELLRNHSLVVRGLDGTRTQPPAKYKAIYKGIFHYHSSRQIESFAREKKQLRELAKHFPRTKRLISTFPALLNATDPNQLLSFPENAKSIEFLTKCVEVYDSTASYDEIVKFSLQIQEQIELYECKLFTKITSDDQFMLQLYEFQLKLFGKIINQFLEKHRDAKYTEEMTWRIVNWIFFVNHYITIHEKRLRDTKRKRVALVNLLVDLGMNYCAQLLASKFHIQLNNKKKSTNNVDSFPFQPLHIDYMIRFGEPVPSIRLYSHHKLAMLKDCHLRFTTIAKSKQHESQLKSLRDVLIARNVRLETSFVPDAWQMELMGHLDARKSVLVSAPTSSGKTFITSYLIEKILRSSDDDIVIFIVPTNALVNQVYCELYASLAKKFQVSHDEEEDQTIGVFTKYLRFNETSCQILISIPQMFQHLLYSQTQEHIDFRRRIKYLILDEVHSMSDVENGKVWEEIILLVNAPILALSATLGDAQVFKTWLETIRNTKVELVSVHHRMVPLNYQFFDLNGFHRVHPLAALNPYQIVTQEIDRIPILTLRECQEFLNLTSDVFAKYECGNIFEVFKHGNHFLNERTIGQVLGREVMQQLQVELTSTIQYKCKYGTDLEKTILLEIFSKLRSPIDDAFASIKDNIEEYDYYPTNLCKFIRAMFDNGYLPTIVFLFDRKSILRSVRELNAFMESSSGTMTSLWKNVEDRVKARFEIEKSIRSLQNNKIDPVLITALRKGVAAHYADLDPVYQKEVERLLKLSMLPVTFATSTLALGVHYPIKSVSIGRYSSYLNQVIFNQCSGRAGRRGYEREGQVVFFSIGKRKMLRYLIGGLPSIQGAEGLSPSFITKILGARSQLSYELYLQAKNALIPYGKKTYLMKTFDSDLAAKLTSPLISTTSNFAKYDYSTQMKYLLRYHVEFLLREGYINESGQPLQLCGVINHLFYTEPFNFLFIHCLVENCFHKLINDASNQYMEINNYWDTVLENNLEPKNTVEDAVLRELLGILCYFFSRYQCVGDDTPLHLPPQYFVECATNHNKNLVHIYSDSVIEALKHMHTASNTVEEMPLSGIELKNARTTNQILYDDVQWQQQRDQLESISIFAGLSGNVAKNFFSEKHFANTLRDSSFLNYSSVPIADVFKSSDKFSSFMIHYYTFEDAKLTADTYHILNEMEFRRHVKDFLSVCSTVYYGLLNQKVLDFKNPFMIYLRKILDFFYRMQDDGAEIVAVEQEESDSEEEDEVEELVSVAQQPSQDNNTTTAILPNELSSSVEVVSDRAESQIPIDQTIPDYVTETGNENRGTVEAKEELNHIISTAIEESSVDETPLKIEIVCSSTSIDSEEESKSISMESSKKDVNNIRVRISTSLKEDKIDSTEIPTVDATNTSNTTIIETTISQDSNGVVELQNTDELVPQIPQETEDVDIWMLVTDREYIERKVNLSQVKVSDKQKAKLEFATATQKVFEQSLLSGTVPSDMIQLLIHLLFVKFQSKKKKTVAKDLFMTLFKQNLEHFFENLELAQSKNLENLQAQSEVFEDLELVQSKTFENLKLAHSEDSETNGYISFELKQNLLEKDVAVVLHQFIQIGLEVILAGEDEFIDWMKEFSKMLLSLHSEIGSKRLPVLNGILAKFNIPEGDSAFNIFAQISSPGKIANLQAKMKQRKKKKV